MKNLLTCIVMLLGTMAYGQGNYTDTSFLNIPEKDAELQEVMIYYNMLSNPPSIEQILPFALDNSPALKIQDALIQKNTYDVKRVKSSWTDAFLIGSTVRYGSYGNETIDELNLGYSFGGTIRFSVFDVVSIRAQVGVYAQERKITEHKKEEVELLIRKQLIVYYNNVLLKQRLLQAKIKAEQSASMHVKMAKQEFLEGEIPVSELARVSEIHAKAQSELIICYTEFKDAYMLLEEFLGIGLKEISINISAAR